MKAEDQTKLNNLYRRYQGYDDCGTKYAFDINFITLQGGRQMKAQRDTGVDNFRKHIDELIENFKDVASIYVTDFGGKSKKSQLLNDTVEIHLLDVRDIDSTQKIYLQKSVQSEQAQTSGMNLFSGFAGLGSLLGVEGEPPPVLIAAKFMDDKHNIERLREKNDEQTRRIAELERKNDELQRSYNVLNDSYEQLQDDADDMEDELRGYRDSNGKQDKIAGLLGSVVASAGKNFIRQNPNLLAGFIPAEQLAGIFAADDQVNQPAQTESAQVNDNLSDEEQERLDDATTVFEWLQTLEGEMFNDVISVISAMRKNAAYTSRILAFLKGIIPNS